MISDDWCEPSGYAASTRAQLEVALREWTGVVEHDPSRGMYNPRLGSQLWPTTAPASSAPANPPR